jgi:hypothetical protein
MDDLHRLLEAAAAADPLDRIGYRDRIAAFGPAAIEAVAPWLEDPRLGAFAVRVITVVADAGDAAHAADVLRSARARIDDPAVIRDVDELLARIAPRRGASRRVTSAT